MQSKQNAGYTILSKKGVVIMEVTKSDIDDVSCETCDGDGKVVEDYPNPGALIPCPQCQDYEPPQE